MIESESVIQPCGCPTRPACKCIEPRQFCHYVVIRCAAVQPPREVATHFKSPYPPLGPRWLGSLQRSVARLVSASAGGQLVPPDSCTVIAMHELSVEAVAEMNVVARADQSYHEAAATDPRSMRSPSALVSKKLAETVESVDKMLAESAKSAGRVP